MNQNKFQIIIIWDDHVPVCIKLDEDLIWKDPKFIDTMELRVSKIILPESEAINLLLMVAHGILHRESLQFYTNQYPVFVEKIKKFVAKEWDIPNF